MHLLRLLLLRLLALIAHPFVRPVATSPHQILVIKPDHLGDLLLATPALAALRAAFPEATITALIGPWARLAIERNPDLDRLLECPFPGFERQSATSVGGVAWLRSKFHPYLLLFRYAALLRHSAYDLVLIGRDDHWWGAALALLAGVPQRVGFAVAECQPFLNVTLPWNPHDHVSQQGLALVTAAQARFASPKQRLEPRIYSTRFDPAPADQQWAATWLETNVAGKRFAVIHPGTGGAAKHWLNERWSAVGDALAERGLQVVLTGGPGEQARVKQVAAEMHAPAHNLAGATSFGQLAALMAQATLVLGVDSGPLHLAAATGAPTIHLYGPGDQRRFGPWGDPERHTVLHSNVYCRPCGVLTACPRGLAIPECMEQIAVAEVVAAMQKLTEPRTTN